MLKYLIGICVIFALVFLGFATMSRKDDGPVRIRIWHQKDLSERNLMIEQVKRYNALNKDHQIEILWKENEELRSNYIIAAMGGTGPDILYGPSDNIGVFSLTKTIQPLDSVFHATFWNRYTPDAAAVYEGKKWSVADQVGNHLTLVYNKKLVPNPPKSLDELIALGKKLTKDTNGDGNPDQYAIVWNYREPFFFVPFLTAFGGWVIDEKTGNPTLDNDKTANAIQFILDLRDKHKIIPKEIDYDTAETLFKEGKAGMVINGPWAWGGYKDANLDFGLAKLPYNNQTQLWATPTVMTKGYSINVNVGPDKMPYVRKVIAYLTGADVQMEMVNKLSTIPVYKSVFAQVTANPPELLKGAIAQYKQSRPTPTNPRLRQIWDGMRGPYQLVMSGAISARKGAKEMQAQCSKLIEDTYL